MNDQSSQTNVPAYGKLIAVTLVIFSCLTIVLSRLDWVPEVPNAEAQPTAGELTILGGEEAMADVVVDVTTPTTAAEPVDLTTTVNETAKTPAVAAVDVPRPIAPVQNPRRIIIDSIGVDAMVSTPDSTAIAVLDTALLDGVVHYPGSGALDQIANVFMFGHSSSLPVIYNQNFKVFNNLKNLTQGDIIRVRSYSTEYVYKVKTVRLTTADEAYVSFDTGERMLTLSTCNTFGEKSERYVVEAAFVTSYKIPA